MKQVRCICGHEHECVARLSNVERAQKAARARMPRITGGKIDVAIESSQKVPFNPPPKDSSVPRPAGAMRPHNLGGELAVESAKERIQREYVERMTRKAK